MDRFEELSKADRFEQLAAQATEQPAKPSLSLGGKLKSIVEPPPGYNEMPMWEKIARLPQSAAEAGLSAITGIGFGLPISVIEYARQRAIGKTPEEAQAIKEKISSALTYQPMSPLAQYGLNIAAAPFSAASVIGEHLGGPDVQNTLDTIMAALPSRAAMPKAPVGRSISAGELARTTTAQKYNMPVSPSSIVDKPSLVMKGAEAVGEVPGLSFIKNRYNKKVNEIVSSKLEEVRNRYAPSEEIEGFTKGVTDAYNQALANIKTERVPVKNLFELMNRYAENKTLSKEAKRLYEAWKIEAGEDGALSVQTLAEIKRQINTIAGKKSRDSKKKILDALLSDISDVPGGEAAKTAIKEIDKQYLWYNKSKQIQNLINGSVSYDAGKFIEPQKFIDNYAKQREGLKRYAPEAVKDLDEIATMMQVGKKGLEGYKKFSKTGIFQNLIGAGGFGTAGWLSPTSAAGMALGGLLTKSLMNPKGIAKNIIMRDRAKGFEGFTEPYQGWTDYADFLKKQETPEPPPQAPVGGAPKPQPGPIEPTTVRTNMAGNYDQYPVYNFMRDNVPDQLTRAVINQIKKGSDFESGEIARAAHKITELYNEEIKSSGMAHELTKDDFIQLLVKELDYYQGHKTETRGESTTTFSPEGFLSEDKPYSGIKPGTPEWIEIWKAHPELQNEMIDYKQKAGMAAMATAYSLLDENDKKKLLPIMKGLTRTRSSRPSLGALKR